MNTLHRNLLIIPFIFATLILGGCVTYTKTRINDPVFAESAEDTNDFHSKYLDSSIGILTPEGATEDFNFGHPDRKVETHWFKVLAYSHVNASRIHYDTGIYAHGSGNSKSVSMVLVFFKPTNTLWNYRLGNSVRQISSYTVTSRNVVHLGITAIKFLILQNMIENALDNATNELEGYLDEKWEQVKSVAVDSAHDFVDDLGEQFDQYLDEHQGMVDEYLSEHGINIPDT